MFEITNKIYVLKCKEAENLYVHKRGKRTYFDGLGIDLAAKFELKDAEDFRDWLKKIKRGDYEVLDSSF